MTHREMLLGFVSLLFLAPALGAAESLVVPDTMLVAAFDHHGGPEVLHSQQLPVPKPKAGEVLVAMRAAGIAVWEAAARKTQRDNTQFPVVLGTEGSGVIVALGPNVHSFKVGERVYGQIGASYAQLAVAQEGQIARMPRSLSFQEAAALGVSGLSALQGIEELLQIQKGETIIIHGATGAVGTLAIQFAKRRGAKVLATVSDDAGKALATRLGADATVNGRSGDIVAAAKALAPKGVDAVLGLAGGDALERCVDSLRDDGEGRFAYLYGVQPQPRSRYGITTYIYSYRANPQELRRLNDAVERSRIEVVVSAEYPLDQAAAAHERLERGGLLGKMVFRIN